MTAQRIGRYEILEELGRGAMGVVYKARDPNIARIVALKTTRVDARTTNADQLLSRSRNEARAAGALNHPHVVTIYDAEDVDGVFYIAMEYIDGMTLQQLEAARDLKVDQIIDVAGQICAGLDYAHEHGIVHRDIKPSNIMINRAGLVKITDFGIAKADSTLTTAGHVLGTPDYMSPEQVKGLPLDGRSDLFSLGVVLYELVTGERPFTGQTVTTVIYKILNEAPMPPRKAGGVVHPGLSAVISKALAKSPDERYQSGADLIRDLRNFKNIAVCEVGVAAAAAPGGPTTVLPATPGQLAAAVKRAPQPPEPEPTAEITAEIDSNPVAPASTAASPPAAPQSSIRLAIVIWSVVIGLLLLGVGAATSGYLHRQRRAALPEQSVANPSIAGPLSTSPPPQAPGDRQRRASVAEAASVPRAHLKAAPSVLNVTSDPPGARILVDGTDTGKLTPSEIRVPPGERSIGLAKFGFKPEQVTVNTGAGQKLDVAAQLKPGKALELRQSPGLQRYLSATGEKGLVVIRSQPPGAQIAIEGVGIRRKTPMRVPAPPGRYTVVISLDGYRPVTRTIEVQAGTVVHVDEFLQPQ